MASILVVDDEKSIRNTVKAFLVREGHDVTTAADAEQALEAVDSGAFDVVVSDIVLPRVNGVTLLAELRKRDADLQVVMMTGEPTVETATEALRSGAFDYLPKPVSNEALLKVVRNALRLREAELDRKRLARENREYQQNLERLVEERTAPVFVAGEVTFQQRPQLRQCQPLLLEDEGADCRQRVDRSAQAGYADRMDRGVAGAAVVEVTAAPADGIA